MALVVARGGHDSAQAAAWLSRGLIAGKPSLSVRTQQGQETEHSDNSEECTRREEERLELSRREGDKAMVE